jgi:hypothetical protein
VHRRSKEILHVRTLFSTKLAVNLVVQIKLLQIYIFSESYAYCEISSVSSVKKKKVEINKETQYKIARLLVTAWNGQVTGPE